MCKSLHYICNYFWNFSKIPLISSRILENSSMWIYVINTVHHFKAKYALSGCCWPCVKPLALSFSPDWKKLWCADV